MGVLPIMANRGGDFIVGNGNETIGTGAEIVERGLHRGADGHAIGKGIGSGRGKELPRLERALGRVDMGGHDADDLRFQAQRVARGNGAAQAGSAADGDIDGVEVRHLFDGRVQAAFLRELWSILGRRREVIDPYWFQMLKGIVQMGMRQAELPFLTGEEPLVLMREYRSVYMNRLCLFKNSRHVLDDEGQIRPQMEAWRFMDGETQLAHFRFAISHDEPGVQISDPVAGLLGKFFSYLSSRNDAELETDKARLSIRQRSALTAMANLLNMSIEENEAFAGYVLPLTDQWRAASMLELDSSP